MSIESHDEMVQTHLAMMRDMSQEEQRKRLEDLADGCRRQMNFAGVEGDAATRRYFEIQHVLDTQF